MVSNLAQNNFETALKFHGEGKYKEAKNLYIQALEQDNNHLMVLNNLGALEFQYKNFDEALIYFKKALRLNPNSPEVHNNIGLIFFNKNNNKEALIWFQKAISLKANYIDALYNLGLLFERINDIKQAIFYHNNAVDLDSHYLNSLYRLVKLYKQIKDYDKVIHYLNKILDLKPNDYDTLLETAKIHSEKGEIKKATELLLDVIKLYPDNIRAYVSLGYIYQANKQINKAMECYKTAIEIDPECIEPYVNLGILYLSLGEYEKGWEYYEKRHKILNPKLYNIAKISKPAWNGSCIDGKKLYIYYEQGFGDTLQLLRYLPILNSMGAKVLFKPQKEIKTLILNNNFDVELIDESILDNEIEFDEHISIMSLPYALKSNINNIPYSEGYLRADKDKVSFYKKNIFTKNDCFKLGIVWQGNPSHQNDKYRSIPLKYFYSLAKFKKLKIYSLQKDYDKNQFKNLPENLEIINLGGTFKDFTDTAAAIENLDLLITIDSVMVHLAGALGKKVWLINQTTPEWRWLLDKEYSPWCNNLKIFNSKEKNNWEEVCAQVIESLKPEVNPGFNLIKFIKNVSTSVKNSLIDED